MMFSGSSVWQETVSHKLVFLCFWLFCSLDDWVYVIVHNTHIYISIVKLFTLQAGAVFQLTVTLSCSSSWAL